MPAIVAAIAPFLPAITAGTAAAGLGLSAYTANNSSIDNANAQKNQAAALKQQQQQQATQADIAKKEAVMGAQGQAQQQTGGSLTDPGTTAFTDLLLI